MNPSLFLATLVALAFSSAWADEKTFPDLKAKDSLRQVSDWLTEDCLKTQERSFVAVSRLSFSLYGPSATDFFGWQDKSGLTHFPDGSTSRDKATPVDFNEFCRRILNPSKEQAEERNDPFVNMRITANPSSNQITPALGAVWLHRQGKREAAQKMWKLAQQGLPSNQSETPRLAFLDTSGSYSPWFLFNRAVSAHMYDHGEIALTALRRLKKLHPDCLERFGAGKRLLVDLERREKDNRLNKSSEHSAPEDFSTWPTEKKTSYLIGSLDQVNARQWGQPGGVALTDDWRVASLIRIGDDAVPALIDCFENDSRLTKSVHYWRDFHPSRTILSVREASLNALMSILQIQLFDASSTGDNFTSREDKKLQAMVKTLRDYWKKNSGIDRDQRLMNVVTDKSQSIDARLQATRSLAWHDHSFGISSMVFSNSARKAGNFREHPLIDRFENPTLAEAVWNLALEEPQNPHRIELALSALVKIRDRRINDSLKAFYPAQKSLYRKLTVAGTISKLGDDRLLSDLAVSLLDGRQNYLKADLGACINWFSSKPLKAGDDFLMTLADKNHPYYRETLHGILDDENQYHQSDDPFDDDSSGIEEPDWPSHPFVLQILKQSLNDRSKTKASMQITGDNVILNHDLNGHPSTTFGATWINEFPCTREKVDLRICDLAADRFHSFVNGLPFYSPLLIGNDEAFKKLHTAVSGKLSELPANFADYLDSPGSRIYFVTLPNVMSQPATSEDFEKGRAGFFLEPKGELLPLKLPAFARTIVENSNWETPRRVIVMQAEKAETGEEYYGCLTRRGLQKFPAKSIAINQ